MARIDKLKDEIGWLKVIFAISIATDISLIAWLVQNYGKVNLYLFIAGVIGTCLIMVIIVWVNNTAYQRIKKLEEMYWIGENGSSLEW